MRIEDIQQNQSISGLDATAVVTVVAVVPVGADAVQVIYRTPDGTMKERLLGRADEDNISVATAERPWSFDGDGDAFKLAVEAKRIDLAFLFDPMMAVHTSNVEPLPHQITAVYESMLPRQPLRYRPGGRSGCWQDDHGGPLHSRTRHAGRCTAHSASLLPAVWSNNGETNCSEKFGLEFRIFSQELELASPSGNPFDDHDRLIRSARPDVAK